MMGSPGASLDSAISRPASSDIGAILRSWNPISAILSTPGDWSLFSHYFYSAGQDGTVNWSKVVLTTFVFAMAGCGLLSSLTWRRLGRPSHERSRFRRGLRRSHTKTSAEETVTSSDEEDIDSNGSLRPGTDSTVPGKQASSHHQEKSEEGEPGLLSILVIGRTDPNQHTIQTLAY